MIQGTLAYLKQCRDLIAQQASDPEDTDIVHQLDAMFSTLRDGWHRAQKAAADEKAKANPGGPLSDFRGHIHPPAQPTMPGRDGGVVRPSPKGPLGGATKKTQPPLGGKPKTTPLHQQTEPERTAGEMDE